MQSGSYVECKIVHKKKTGLGMNERSSREHGEKELQPILEEEEEEEELKPQSPHEATTSRLRHLVHNSLVRTAAKNLALICTW